MITKGKPKDRVMFKGAPVPGHPNGRWIGGEIVCALPLGYYRVRFDATTPCGAERPEFDVHEDKLFPEEAET